MSEQMETAYQKVKVNNEMEWCEVEDLETKGKIEKILLNNRISYYITWTRPKFFSSDKNEHCVFCVNQLQKDAADEAIACLEDEEKSKITFINKKVNKSYY
jgi:diaminopimelate epimerase